ncbi:MAG: dihydroorotate dehydrogenase electron transfer subunit [Paludibacteraceae bacterium]|nr:dihydroorotate dehydrogenase electron transfer subunit [Paludibacteraceae bacterium]
MKKYLLDCQLVSNIPLSNRNYILRVTHKEPLPPMLPGQFVELRVDNSMEAFLRRPISIHDIDYTTNEMDLLIQSVGVGTQKLSHLVAGDTLNMIAPLGNIFTMPTPDMKHVLLVGGGVGVAPLLYLGRMLQSYDCEVNYLLGARTASDLVQLDHFRKYGNVYLTTEDATDGEKGYVTNHSLLESKRFDKIYTCGPTPMMKAVATYATTHNIECEASLENTMACGFGVCLCCVTDTVEGHKCVCTEGPVFNTKTLKW